MDTGKVSMNIYMYVDLCKAFDTLDQSILFDKLICYGIRGVANNRFHIALYQTNLNKFVFSNLGTVHLQK